MTVFIVRGYWCPVCRFAFRAHTDAELSACADRADEMRGET